MLIETKRLTLSNLCERDRENLFALFTDTTVNKTYLLPDFDSIDAFSPMFTNLLKISAEEKRVFLAIRLDDELIGVIHEAGAGHPEGTTEIGYCLLPAYHNLGYTSEAFAALIPVMFARGYRTVEAGAFITNPASLRVMEKCGLTPIDKIEEVEYRGENHRIVYRSIEAKKQE